MITYDHISIPEATLLQQEMNKQIVLKPFEKKIKTIAGADISFNKFSNTVFAGIIVLSYPEMKILSYSLIETETNFPYVAGFLSFREIPSLMQAWNQLPEKPDVLVLDGQGISHPRRMGIASHFGVLENQATIGCAKSMLFGKLDDLGLDKNSYAAILNKENDLLGYALRTKNAVKPIYISPGNLITAEESLEIIKECVGRYRIPEPTRLAHEMVNSFRTGKLTAGFHTYEEKQKALF